jgi:sterol O-acyltransferase
MVMKMHSYMTVNGQLQRIDNEARSLLAQLKSAAETVGGWDKAVEVASAKKTEQQARTAVESESGDTSNPDIEPTPIGTPSIPEGSSTSYVDAKTASALRKRLAAISRTRSSETSVPTTLSTSSDGNGPGKFSHFNDSSPDTKTETGISYVVEEGGDNSEGLNPHVLVYHPDEKISAIANEYSELQSELVSAGPTRVEWQDTITWKTFTVYQLIPTLVYELEYPRTDRSVFSFASLCVLSLIFFLQYSTSLRIRENSETKFRLPHDSF